MRQLIFLTALMLAFNAFGFSQKQKQGPDPSIMLDSGTRVEGQLQSAVDVQKSKVGDQVILKTTKSIKQNGHIVVPKGTNLIGRITEVQQRSKSNGSSRLGLVFDRIEGRDLSAPISASIVSITNAGARGTVADDDIFASSGTSARASGSGFGGSLLGGVTNTVGSVVNTTAQATSSVVNTAGQTVGSVGRTINGIHISNSVNGNVQSGSTLSARDRNIRLEKGTTVQVQLNSSVRGQGN